MGPIARKRAQLREQAETRPGQILLLGVMAAAPIAVAFILLPAVFGVTHRAAILATLYGTPALAAWGALIYARSPPEVRGHNAARVGALVAGVSFVLWMLVLIPAILGRV